MCCTDWCQRSDDAVCKRRATGVRTQPAHLQCAQGSRALPTSAPWPCGFASSHTALEIHLHSLCLQSAKTAVWRGIVLTHLPPPQPIHLHIAWGWGGSRKPGEPEGSLSLQCLCPSMACLPLRCLSLCSCSPDLSVLLAMCFSLQWTLSALPLQTLFIEELGENLTVASLPQSHLSCIGKPLRKPFSVIFSA